MITWDNLNKIKQIRVLTNEIMKWDKKDLEYFVVALVGLNIRDLSRSDSDVDFVLLGSAHQVLIKLRGNRFINNPWLLKTAPVYSPGRARLSLI